MSYLNAVYQKFPLFFLLAHLAAGLGYCLYIAWFTTTLGGDTLEHIHSSWLVYAEFVPYKDFFQHHNPLLWYLFAPFVGLHAYGLDDNVITSSVVTAAILASFLTYYYLYLIASRFLIGKRGGVIAAAIAFTPYVLVSVVNFRPDNFMVAAFFAGLYYYFGYLQEKKLWSLSLSMLLFWASFMFLQKIIFTLVLLAAVTLYLLCRSRILWRDMLYALLLPFGLSLLFAVWLWHHDILSVWYQSNFTFNLHIPELFAGRRVGEFWTELRLLLAGAGLAVLFCWRGANLYFKILAVLFVAELCQRLFYFSAFAYYFYQLLYLAALLSAVFLEEKIFKRCFALIYVLLAALAFCMYKPAVYNGNIGSRTGRFYEPLNKKILRYITPCDYVLNGDGTLYNLYNRDPHYYWNLLGQLDVIGAEVGIRPLMDINRVILTYKPKIISAAPYRSKYASERGIDIYVHRPDMELVSKYYKRFDNSDVLYILKPEYSRLKCDFDYKQRRYRAYD